MAHGYAMVTGRPQVVMVHVIVGAGNAVGRHHQRRALATCRCCSPPAATRSPRRATAGSRDRPIHWAQESFDQAAMVREFVKWDYELQRFASSRRWWTGR